MDNLDTLLNLLFSGHPTEDALHTAITPLVRQGCRLVHLQAGEAFIHAGLSVDSVWILLDGSARVVCYNTAGAASIQDTLFAPQMFGLVEVIDGRIAFGASVVANVDSALLRVPAPMFRRTIDACAPAARVIINNLAYLTVRNMNHMEYYTLRHPRDTLILHLYHCCRSQPLPFTLFLSRRELAEVLHIGLRSLYRYLDQLKEDGLCSVVKGKVTITPEHFSRLKAHCAELE